MLDPFKKQERKNLDCKKKKKKIDPPNKFFLVMAMLILSASVKRFSVSRMREFFPTLDWTYSMTYSMKEIQKF